MGEDTNIISEKLKTFLYRKYISKQDFKRELCSAYNSKSDLKTIYLACLKELHNAIIEGNSKNFTHLSKILDYFSTQFENVILNEFFDSLDNPLKNTNIIILCCKHNRTEILEFVLRDLNRILYNLTSYLKRTLLLTDLDDSNHNTFYYAIKSNNIDLFDKLFTKAKKNFLSNHTEKLDEIISCAYDELKLKNISISTETEINVEAKLLDLRFLSKTQRSDEGNIGSTLNILERIVFVKEHISILVSEFLNVNDLDEKFFYVMKSIIKNVHILKQQLKFTYERVPWEEIEYCLTAFISSFSGKCKINFFCKVVLTKSKLLHYLIYFSKLLEKEANFIKDIGDFTLMKIPKAPREQIVLGITSACPELTELYEDYQKIRDIDSLTKIDTYIKLLLSVDTQELVGRLTILRSLQVIGEHLKNTLESPKLSESTSELFLFSLPKNTRDIIVNIRNSLSHAPSFLLHGSLSERYYSNIQNDIKKVGDVISNILYNKQMSEIKKLVRMVLATNDVNKIQEIASVLCHIDPHGFSDSSLKTEHKRIVKFVELLKLSIPSASSIMKKQLEEVNEMLNLVGMTSGDFFGLALLKNLKTIFNSLNLNCVSLNSIKTMIRQAHDNFLSNEKHPDELKKALNIALMIYLLNSDNIKSNKEELLRLVSEIVFLFEGSGVDCISKFREHLKLNQVQQDIRNTKPKFDNPKLSQNISHLKSLLNFIDDSKLIDNVSSFLKNKNLEAAVEMSMLEILSSLSSSKNFLENNLLYLDDNSPLLIGKSLRNHLAHENVIVRAFISDPSIALILNAKKIMELNIDTMRKKIGKLVKEDPKRLKDKFDYNLIAISYQQRMFLAAKEGNIVNFNHWLSKGADIHARCINKMTSLHYAAMSSNLELVKFILSHKISVNSKNSNGETPLHIATANGRYDIVEYFLKNAGANIDSKDNFDRRAIHVAIQNGKKEVVELLLECNAKTESSKITPLTYAIMYNHIDIFEKLLEKDKNVDISDSDGTLLLTAAEFGHIELVNYLLDRGVNVNVKTDTGWTPLHSAALRPGKADIVTALIRKGADVNAKVLEGFNALYNAVFSGDETIVEVLLKHGSDVNIVNKTLNYTCLYIASREGYNKIAKLLLEHQADIHLVNFVGESPLHVAAQGGHLTIISYLLDHGAMPDVRDHSKSTPLFRAAYSGSLDAVELLVSKGSCVNLKDEKSFTPLSMAVMNGHDNITEYLIKQNCDVNSSDHDGTTPLHLACIKGKTIIIDLLLANNAKVNSINSEGSTPLHFAVSNNCSDAVSLLLKSNAEPNVSNLNKETPLQSAIHNNNSKIVQILVNHGACIHTEDLSLAVKSEKNKELVNILLESCKVFKGFDKVLKSAVKKGSLEIVESLVNKIENINAVDSDNYTVLHHAAARGHDGMVKLLLKRGAQVDPLSTKFETPLYLAALNGHDDVVQILLKSGANINVSCNGLTPLQAASYHGNYDVVKFLLENGVNVHFANDGTPLECAIDQSNLKIIKLLHEYMPLNAISKVYNDDGWSMLHIAAKQKDLEIVKYLVDQGVDPHVKSISGMKPIHVAASEGHVHIVEYFVNKGVSVHEVDFSKMSVLHHASDEGHLNVVKFLIGKGAKVNAQANDGSTPLHCAASSSYMDVIIELLLSGAAYDIEDNNHLNPGVLPFDVDTTDFFDAIDDMFMECLNPMPNSLSIIKDAVDRGALVNVKNKEGLSALHYIALNGDIEIANFLLKNKADPNSTDKNLYTPLHNAAKNSHVDIVHALLCNGAVYNARAKDGETPVSLTTNKKILDILKIVSDSFECVENKKYHVINELKKIKDVEKLKVIMKACNSKQQTLIIAATKNNFRKVDSLLNLIEGDVSAKIDEALQLALNLNYQKALHILNSIYDKRMAILGPDNPGTLEILVHIQKIVYKQGEYIEALRLTEEIFHKQKEMLGMDNKDTLSTRAFHALILHRLSRDEEALDIFKVVFPKQKSLLGPYDTETISTELHMAGCLDKLEKFDEALFHTKSVYERLLKTTGPMSQGTIAAQNNIAMILLNQGKTEKSLEIYREVYHKKKLFYGETHADTLRTLYHIGVVLMQTGNYKEGIATFKEVLAIQKNVLGISHPDTIHTLSNLANSYFMQGQRREAIKMFKEIYNNIGSVLGTKHPLYSEVQMKMDLFGPLLNKFSDFKIMDIINNGQRDFATAAKKGDITALKRLLDEGVDIDEKDEDGRTALHYAVNGEHVDAVRLLIENGANVCEVSQKGNSPLHTATLKQNLTLVEVLMESVSRERKSYLVNGRTTSSGTSSLHVAARDGSIDIVKALLRNGANYHVRNREGKLPLDISSDKKVIEFLVLINNLFDDSKNGNSEFIKKLMSLKSDEFTAVTAARDEDGNTLLQVATRNGHRAAACKLLELLTNK